MSARLVRVGWMRADERRACQDWLGLLALLLERPPEALDLVRGARGKPGLAAGQPYFSVAHARGLVAVAVCDDAEIGIDVEHVRPVPRLAAVARRHLRWDGRGAPDPGERRTADLLAAWCRLEARLKCTGAGLGDGDGPEVRPRDTEVCIADLCAPPGFVAALAVHGWDEPAVEALGPDDLPVALVRAGGAGAGRVRR